MAWSDLFTGLALVFVIEGTMLFASPGLLRRTYERMYRMPDAPLRVAGFLTMLAGVGLLYWIRF